MKIKRIWFYSFFALLTGYIAFHCQPYSLGAFMFGALMALNLIGLAQHLLRLKFTPFKEQPTTVVPLFIGFSAGLFPSIWSAWWSARTWSFVYWCALVVFYLGWAFCVWRHHDHFAGQRKTVLMFIGSCLWRTAERLHIRLGRFAPVIFGWMVGVKGTRVE